MTTFKINPCANSNAGDAREWALCDYYGIPRHKHDSKPFDEASDIETGDIRISVKSSKFSLMSAGRCNGKTDFDGIWNEFEARTHSNLHAYVTLDWTVYIMDIHEFKLFVYAFCSIQRESSKNGGGAKIKCREESAKMLKWLANMAAA